jgi:hypothetical protein
VRLVIDSSRFKAACQCGRKLQSLFLSAREVNARSGSPASIRRKSGRFAGLSPQFQVMDTG